jgi:hypothetical protein
MFCGKNDSRPSQEDVFARWIARQFSGRKKQRFRVNGASGSGPLEPIMPDTEGNLGLLTLAPCRRCNNGWMSVLENEVSKIMKPLIAGKSAALSVEDRITITRWAVKTAMTYNYREHTEHGQPLYFCEEYRRGMCADQGFPPLTSVFALRYAGQYAMSATGGIVLLRFSWDEPGTPPFEGKAYSMTVTLGQLAIQLITVDGQPEFGRCATIRVPVADALVRYGTQIFPLRGETATWPNSTTVAFRDEHIRRLADNYLRPEVLSVVT